MTAKQISTKQFIAVQFLIGLAVKMFMLPALLLRIVGKDSYMVMLIWLGVEFINLALVLWIMRRNPDKTIYDILRDCLGKIVARAVVVVFSAFMLLKLLLILSEVKMFFSVTMYAEINWQVMIVPLLVLFITFAIRSLRDLGRTAQFIFPIVLVSTLALSGLLLGDVQGGSLLPVLENGFSPVAKGLTTFPMWFGDVTFLLLFLGNVKQSRALVWGSFVIKLITAALVLVFSTTLFSTYSNISTLIDYGNNISNMTQFSIGAQDYGRFDLLFYCVWMLSVFIKMATVFYFITRNVGFVVGSRNNYAIAVATAVVVYVLTAFVMDNENVAFEVCTGWIKYVLCPPAILMPTALVVMSLIKYEPNYHVLVKRGGKREFKKAANQG